MKRRFFALGALTLVGLLCGFASKSTTPVYKNPKYTVEQRVKDLLSRMTLAEKAAQLDMLRAKDVVLNEGELSDSCMAIYIDSMCIGSIHDFYPSTAELANELQRRAVEHTRLGIPLIFIEEALHGYSGTGSTTFPIPLANASSWDTLLVGRMGRAIGTEARAHGVHFVLSPNLDLAREIRWGRVEETFGEDTYLSSRMGVNIIKGMQGDTLSDHNTVASEPKHFAVHGIPENGHNASAVTVGEREARSVYLPVFEKAVTEAGARGIMAAYHELDGVPCAANHWLLTDVLRGEWGFKGFVVSDLGAIHKQIDSHLTAATNQEAIVSSINAGLNMQFYDFSYKVFQSNIIRAVEKGLITSETLDCAVGDVLRVKFELGLFDDPYTDTSLIGEVHRCSAHRDLAKELALGSITLLKNDNHTLPLRSDIKSIALVGNLSDVSALGGYSPNGATGTTVYEALKERFGDDVQINLIESDISEKLSNIPTKALRYDDQKGLKLEFFNNDDLQGKAVYTTLDANLTAYWHNLSPAPGVNDDNFSARWSGDVMATVAGVYEFALTGDDRARLYINDQLLIDNWDYSLANRTILAQVNLVRGANKIRLEYNEKDNFAGIRTQWRLVEMNSSNFFSDITSQIEASDAVIVVIGEGSAEVGEGMDKSNLSVSDFDNQIVDAALASGRPMATVLMSGRPLILPELDSKCPAIVEAWFAGERGGEAICDVLFGDCNPSGHLTISFPRDQNMMPSYYSRKPSSNRKYVDGNGLDVLYGFGHGLSYTDFEYSNLVVRPTDGTVAGDVEVSLDVCNTGDRAGADVVQLYVRDVVSSVATPVISLKGFSKLYLEPGETQRVTMRLTPEHLSLINIDMERVTEPGEFLIMIGKSSSDIVLKEKITLR